MRGRRILQGKSSIDKRLDLSTLQERPDLTSQPRRDLPFLRDAARAQRRPGNGQPTPQNASEIDRRGIAAHESDDNEPAFNGERHKVARNVISANDIEDQIDA